MNSSLVATIDSLVLGKVLITKVPWVGYKRPCSIGGGGGGGGEGGQALIT